MSFELVKRTDKIAIGRSIRDLYIKLGLKLDKKTNKKYPIQVYEAIAEAIEKGYKLGKSIYQKSL